MPEESPRWLEPLVRIALDFRQGTKSIRKLFEEAAPDLADELAFRRLVTARLQRDPQLVSAWQEYSYGKRVDSGPWLDHTKVGLFEPSRGMFGKRSHPTPADACADFLFREARSVLEHHS